MSSNLAQICVLNKGSSVSQNFTSLNKSRWSQRSSHVNQCLCCVTMAQILATAQNGSEGLGRMVFHHHAVSDVFYSPSCTCSWTCTRNMHSASKVRTSLLVLTTPKVCCTVRSRKCTVQHGTAWCFFNLILTVSHTHINSVWNKIHLVILQMLSQSHATGATKDLFPFRLFFLAQCRRAAAMQNQSYLHD